MNKQLIVSHYEKNIDWLKNINNDTEIIIYDKGLRDSNFIKLPNIGREPHTYIHHILANYDNLTEWTIFSQDSTVDHVLDWVRIINSSEDIWKRDAVMTVLKSYYFCDYGVYRECGEIAGEYPMGKIWRSIFTTPFPEEIFFAPACNFIVHRDQILHRSFEYYNKLQSILECEHLSPWVFERYFNYIFNPSIN